jgi:hypothetical protein
MEPEVAVMVELPTPVPVATPVLTIVATVVKDELQLTALVRVCVLPSLYVPVAVNCWLVPFAIETVTGLTAMATSSGAVTATAVELVIAPELALMLAAPIAVPMTSPAALTGATAGESDAQVTDAVRSCVLPSL